MGLNNLLCLGQDLFFPIPRIPSVILRYDCRNLLQVQKILLDQSVTFSPYSIQSSGQGGGWWRAGQGSTHHAGSGRCTNLAQILSELVHLPLLGVAGTPPHPYLTVSWRPYSNMDCWTHSELLIY